VLRAREDGSERFDELHDLLQDHAEAGSTVAARLVHSESLAADAWLVEPDRHTAAPDPNVTTLSAAESSVPLRA
jgi:hypothetical protein